MTDKVTLSRASGKQEIFDGCTAAAHVAYSFSDVAFIYPITPSSSMAELADAWASKGRLNLYGQRVEVKEMQSEGGAAGGVHGALAAGALATTFTASQGLLLMIPNMYKIAGELMPAVFHVSARALAGQALSIFGDHSDVMAVRQTGWALISSHSVQQAHDVAIVAHISSLRSSIPFVHFFDGFRTSHELSKIEVTPQEALAKLIPREGIQQHRDRALNPTHPHLRGTSQGPDVFFQCVEAANPYYNKVPDIVSEAMKQVSVVTGRHLDLFVRHGPEEAEFCVVIMGSGAPTLCDALDCWNTAPQNPKASVVMVHLFRPWSAKHFISALPKGVKRVCVLDRTKESGSLGEPLYLDVCTSILTCGQFMQPPMMIAGRYGLGSKDFTPLQGYAVFTNLVDPSPKNQFTVGIVDDVTHLSLEVPAEVPKAVCADAQESMRDATQCVFWGMGSDGTVGANKNAIKIIGEYTDLYVQGYFAYDAHKSGGVTVSHLRFGPQQIDAPYLIQAKAANYVAVHHPAYLRRYSKSIMSHVKQGGKLVINCPFETDEELEKELPGLMKREIAKRGAELFVINANKVAAATGMGKRINSVLLTVFFRLSGVLPLEKAISLFKQAIEKTYAKKGEKIVKANWASVDAAGDAIREVKVPSSWAFASLAPTAAEIAEAKSHGADEAPTFITDVMLPVEKLEGDSLPVSVFAPGGSMPMGTTAYEKRGIALSVPTVDMDKCTQCNYCSFVCPHAAVRPFLVSEEELEKAPSGFETAKAKGGNEAGAFQFRIQVSPLDCTGCELCVNACPDNALSLHPIEKVVEEEGEKWNFAEKLPERSELFDRATVKGSQFAKPLLEFSGACEGCGETPYVKLLTQLFGERMLIANATGCSSIWGGSYPAVPYTVNEKGQGPAWGNSLFEDNAEYGFGMATAISHRRKRVYRLMVSALEKKDSLVEKGVPVRVFELMSEWTSSWKRDPEVCQTVFEELPPLLEAHKEKHQLLADILGNKDVLVKISQWIIGGDGWAYDIGFGGLDHVLASGEDVNVLVLDTEVYSNTGGQMSKATPLGAIAKFGAAGKRHTKKDLGMMAMSYGGVYVASCALGANYSQVVRAMVEAESFDGPSLIMAYSPCTEHGYTVKFGQQAEDVKMAVESGYWVLYRYNPALKGSGQTSFALDSKKLKIDLQKFLERENRFATLMRSDPEMAGQLQKRFQEFTTERFDLLKARAEGLNDADVFKKTFEALHRGLAQTAADANTATKKISVPEITVLFGTETGNAEEVAKRVGREMKSYGFGVSIKECDDVEPSQLAQMDHVIVIISTAGQGEFPSNALEFWDNLKDPSLEEDLLKNVKYSVFGLGDSSYCFFCKAAREVDERMSALGAKRIQPAGLGDDKDAEGYDTALTVWKEDLFVELRAAEIREMMADKIETKPQFKVLPVKTAEGAPPPPYKQVVYPGGFLLPLTEMDRMTPEFVEGEKDPKDVRHLMFDLEHPLCTRHGLRYSLGDSLAIFPVNDGTLAEEFCAHMGLDPSETVQVVPAEAGEHPSRSLEAAFKHPMTVKQMMMEVLDFAGKPSRNVFESLLTFVSDAEDKERAKAILTPQKEELPRPVFSVTGEEIPRLNAIHEETLTTFDVFKRFFPNLKLTIPQLIDCIGVLKARYYSIASSRRFWDGKKLELCIGIVDWTAPSGTYRMGECTGYLTRLTDAVKSAPVDRPVTLSCSLKATAFTLPPDDTYPIMLVSMGTGIAPFRAFVQQRAWLKRNGRPAGKIAVFFGCRRPHEDWLYGEEMEKYKEEGIVTFNHVAFSRVGAKKVYIQQKIAQEAELVHSLLVKEGGYFYLCGSSRNVPQQVRSAVIQCFQKAGGMAEKEANDLIFKMTADGRYNVEAWS
uniref:pyruvate dehydrogenase (NADP(+)) n=1 Tax=Chromera velia CCMP2878 TaxID=1169474 RepID=A0A0G4HB32_9ALVE|eukprot:Cvel_6121.t1-p1 / transcript=Cvel_6121.t1 / gene=Cvel_6121 / organism=Chromera_velia_CCMP2878 / gene_product=Pyruvate dehydrogenase [NADP( )], putative / transcript_product=Pyruvate dehydrogenase [NADP( )], putative / location=Cvel_scaffold295:66115-80301(-) / protein_length=1868 / sequence_SO=supercontig / SO=protein_coding / is_pseudo=false